MLDKLVLGTVQFGLNYGINNVSGKPSLDKVFSILDYAYSKGLKTLDTAIAYGDSLQVIGKYHNTYNHNKFNIITKFHLNDNSSIDEQLNILNVPKLHTYLFHSFNDYQTCPEHLFKQLLKLKLSDKFKNIGVSVYTNDQFHKAALDKKIDVIQFPFNLLDNNNQRLKYIKIAKDNNKELHCRSIFLQGLFLKDVDKFPKNLIPLIPYLKKVNEIANNNKISINQMALLYAVSNKNIDKVLFGVDTLEQLKQNLNYLEQKINNNFLNEIDKTILVKEIELLNPSNWN